MWLNASLTAFLLLAGWRDWRSGLVSNWITIPLLGAGIVGLIMHADLVIAAIALALTFAALRGWMGGADWKVLIGLFGLWPAAGLAALLFAALWGLAAMLVKRDRNARFPGITAFAIGATLTLFVQLWYQFALN